MDNIRYILLKLLYLIFRSWKNLREEKKVEAIDDLTRWKEM